MPFKRFYAKAVQFDFVRHSGPSGIFGTAKQSIVSMKPTFLAAFAMIRLSCP
jgi:hypothetical protein